MKQSLLTYLLTCIRQRISQFKTCSTLLEGGSLLAKVQENGITFLRPNITRCALVVALILGSVNVWGADVTYVYKDAVGNPGNGGDWYSGSIDSYTTWEATKGGSNPPKYYDKDTGLRVYNGGSFSISSTKTLKEITLTFAGTSYTFSSSNKNTTQTVTPNATSYSWEVSNSSRLQKVEITYAAASTTPYYVSWEADGTYLSTAGGNVTEGEKPTLPSNPSDCSNGKAFIGWIDSEYSSDIEAHKDDIFKSAADADPITKVTHFVAVYATITSGETSTTTETLDITSTNFTNINGGSGYAAYNGNRTFTTSGDKGLTITSSNVMVNSKQLQFKSNEGYLYNTNSLGTISQIEVEPTTAAITVYEGGNENPTTTVSGNNGVYNLSKPYFKIKGGSNTPKLSKITISISSESSSELPPSDYTTSCSGSVTPTKPIAPTIAPAGGTYNAEQSIRITHATLQDAIWYTINDENINNGDVYENALSLPNAAASECDYKYTVRALAMGDENSDVASQTYYFQTATPTISVASGTYTSAQTVRIDCPTATSIWYTIDGTDPAGKKSNGITSGESITINASCKLRVVAERTNFDVSEEASADYTINIATPRTVTWMNNGVKYGEGTVLQGEKVATVPTGLSAPTGCSEKIFVGWTALTTYADNEYTDAPSDLFTDVAGSPTILTNTTFHAVFADGDAGGGGYKKISSKDELTDGTYLIVADGQNVAYAGRVSGQTYGAYASVSITDNTIADKGSAVEVTITGTHSLFSIFDGTYYLSSPNGNNITFNSSAVTDWKLTDDLCINSVGQRERYFQYNATSGSERFACYKDTQKDAYLYKKSASATNYTTYCESDQSKLHTVTVTPVTIKGCSATALPTSVYEGKRTTITATVAEGYTFAGWTVTGATPDDATALETTITMGTSDVTVTAEFVEGTYHLVTADMPALTAGDKVLIASYWEETGNNKYVVAGEISGNRLQVVNAAFSADKKTVACLPTGHTLFTLGGESGAYTLLGASGYLTAPNATNNDLAWNGTAATWDISVDASAHATMTSNSRYLTANLGDNYNYFIAADNIPGTEKADRFVQLYRKYDICGLEVTPTTTKYEVNGTVDKDELTIKAVYTNGNTVALTDEQKATVTLVYDFSEVGEDKEVVATYTAANGRIVTGSYTVDVENLSKIIFKMNGTELATYEALSGTTLTTEQITAAEDAARGAACTEPVAYTFVGWSDKQGEVNEVTVTTSTDFIESGRTFYAVYQVNDGSPITDLSELTDGAKVVLVNSQGKALNSSAGVTNQTAGGKIVNPASALVWTLENSGSSYKFKNSDGKYLSAADQANFTTVGLDRAQKDWTIVADQGGTAGTFNLVNGIALEYYNNKFQLYGWSSGYAKYYRFYIYDVTTTTQPLCGPYLQITGETETWLTGGTRNTVTTKVAFAGDRLEPSDDGVAPSVYVSASDISSTTIKVETDDIVQTVTKNADGTYKIEGTALVRYTPTVANTSEDVTITFTVKYNTGEANAKPTYTVHTRALPAQFVIAAKHEGNWYALPGDMDGASTHDAIAIEVNADGTLATQARNTAIYTFDGVPNTGDRQYVRLIGSKSGGYLWASSSDGTGIQNNTKSSPAGDKIEYDWLLNTTDNATYAISNGKHIELASGRQLGYHKTEGKFGNYKTGASYDLKILPVEDICTYFDAPTGLAVTSKTSTTLSLSWDVVTGAAGYEYSIDNGATWTRVNTNSATIEGLTAEATYTVLVRASDGPSATNCAAEATISETLPACDFIPTAITVIPASVSATVTWKDGGTTATVTLYSDAACTAEVASQTGITTQTATFTGLTASSTYYVVVSGNGTCAADAVQFTTEPPYIDVVDWGTYEGADSDLAKEDPENKTGVTLNLSDPDATATISVGKETIITNAESAEATELFFSKYYEATGDLKLLGIYNGTKNDIDLADYNVYVSVRDQFTSSINTFNLATSTGLSKIPAGTEFIFWYAKNADLDASTGTQDLGTCIEGKINGKLNGGLGFSQPNWFKESKCVWSGKNSIALFKNNTMVDIIGAYSGTPDASATASQGGQTIGRYPADLFPGDPFVSDVDKSEEAAWFAIGDKYGSAEKGVISTNRCLLIRKNNVTSGQNAVMANVDDFATLSTEWLGENVGGSVTADDATRANVCESFSIVASFDYTDYYVTYTSVVENQTLGGMKNTDGTFTIPLDVDNMSCKRIKIETKKGEEVILSTQVRVPIIIDASETTDGTTFDLIGTIHKENASDPELTTAEIAKICETCDVVVKGGNVTLTHDGQTDYPQINDLYVYPGAKVNVTDGVYKVNSVTLRSEGDVVPHLIMPAGDKGIETQKTTVNFTKRIINDRYYFFSLPFDCKVSDIHLSNGGGEYGRDFLIKYYDGAKRAQDGSKSSNWVALAADGVLIAGQGYNLAVSSDQPAEVVFPMTVSNKALHTLDNQAKNIVVTPHGFDPDGTQSSTLTPNNLGWNLVGNPYFTIYGTGSLNDEDMKAGQLVLNLETNEYEWQTEDVYLTIPDINETNKVSTYKQVLASGEALPPFYGFFVQVNGSGTLDYEAGKRAWSAPARYAHSVADERPVYVGISLSDGKQTDETSLVINDRFTQAYEIGADLEKMIGFGDKPQVYVKDDAYRYAFKALNENDAAATNTIGVYLPAKEATTYTFDVMRKYDLSRVQGVYLTDHVVGTMTNLLQRKYTFTTGYAYTNNRFSLSVVLAPKAVTSLTNTEIGWSVWQDAPQHIRIQGLNVGDDVRVVDATGKLVEHVTVIDTATQFSLPTAGAYCVQVIGVNGLDVRKVVVK